MIISDRLRSIREEKHLSQGEIERRTGLKRCYISRVENGHTIPSLDTLEKFARALEVPLYQFFYDGDDPPSPQSLSRLANSNDAWGFQGDSARYVQRLCELLARVSEQDRQLLLHLTSHMAQRNRPRRGKGRPASSPKTGAPSTASETVDDAVATTGGT